MAEHAHGDPSATWPQGPPARLVAGLAPLDQVEATLRWLCTGPDPLAIDGRALRGGLPRRAIRCDELAGVLAHPSTSQETKRRVWALIVDCARAGRPGWVVAAAGVALPGLRRAAGRLAHAASRADVEADLLEGFLAALPHVDTSRSGICARLVNAAHTCARARAREQEAAAAGEAHFAPASALPPPPVGHPDLLLARAARLGVVTDAEAELVGATRLEQVTVGEFAQRLGWTRAAAYHRRAQAEAKLAAAIRAGTLSDPTAQVVTEACATVMPDPTGESQPATGG